MVRSLTNVLIASLVRGVACVPFVTGATHHAWIVGVGILIGTGVFLGCAWFLKAEELLFVKEILTERFTRMN